MPLTYPLFIYRRLEVAEGQTIPIVELCKGPDGTVLTTATAGQPGTTNWDISVYRLTSDTSGTVLYTATIATASLMQAAPVTGSGWTNNPDGYNLLWLVAGGDTLFTLEGGNTYRIELRGHLTGTTGGVSWKDFVIMYDVTVRGRLSA